MQFTTIKLNVYAIILAVTTASMAANCESSPGIANGECVWFYSEQNCAGPSIGSYKPTGAGNCFQYASFSSVKAAGDGVYGTDCYLFSDYNCQDEIANTGNVKYGSGKCASVAVNEANSMICDYRA